MSKTILLFSTTDEKDDTDDLVFRQQSAIPTMEADCTLVRNEFPLMRCAYELGLPVPEPLWFESRADLGPDFLVMKRAQGSQLGEPFKPYLPMGEDLIMQIAELLARLHGAGLEPFRPFLAQTGQEDLLGMTIKQAQLQRIRTWEASLFGKAAVPNPGMVWLFDWLKRNVPDNDRPPTIVHGDFNIHNLLVENGRVTAWLDWEWGHPGDPAEDLYNFRLHVDTYSDWDRFCRHYFYHGGPEFIFSQKAMNFNRCLTNSIYSAVADRLNWFVATDQINDIVSVFGSNIYNFEFHKLALEASLRVA